MNTEDVSIFSLKGQPGGAGTPPRKLPPSRAKTELQPQPPGKSEEKKVPNTRALPSSRRRYSTGAIPENIKSGGDGESKRQEINENELPKIEHSVQRSNTYTDGETQQARKKNNIRRLKAAVDAVGVVNDLTELYNRPNIYS
mmetsp:Transcript_12158/g.15930  ORF Transcript_12158/g.15930 Transcript_12158/m.15930 type:complete len:142 (-) Transcript_12158:177-602(-)